MAVRFFFDIVSQISLSHRSFEAHRQEKSRPHSSWPGGGLTQERYDVRRFLVLFLTFVGLQTIFLSFYKGHTSMRVTLFNSPQTNRILCRTYIMLIFSFFNTFDILKF